MKKIWNFIINIPQDKLLHIVILGFITALTILAFKICGYGKPSCAFGWLVGFVFGIGKEIYDELKTRSSEAGDWLADVIVITFVVLYSLFLML